MDIEKEIRKHELAIKRLRNIENLRNGIIVYKKKLNEELSKPVTESFLFAPHKWYVNKIKRYEIYLNTLMKKVL